MDWQSSNSSRKSRNPRSDSSIHSSNTKTTIESESTIKRKHHSKNETKKKVPTTNVKKERRSSQLSQASGASNRTPVSSPRKIKPRQVKERNKDNISATATSPRGFNTSPPHTKVGMDQSKKQMNKKKVPSPNSHATSSRINRITRNPRSNLAQSAMNKKSPDRPPPRQNIRGGVDTGKKKSPSLKDPNPNRSILSNRPKKKESPTKKYIAATAGISVKNQKGSNRNDKNGQEKKLVARASASSNDLEENGLIKENPEKKSFNKSTPIAHNHKNIEMSKEEKEDACPEYVPEYDLHHNIQNSEWENLYRQLEELSMKTDQIVPEISVMSKEDASVLHTCCWKAPPGLTHIIIKLLPTRCDGAQDVYVLQDKDGNTPLHLCAANMMPFHDHHSSKPIIDISVLESLITIAPEVLQIQNKSGETPLHLFVTSVAASASTFSSYPPSSELFGNTLKALALFLDNLPSKESAVIKDNTGATPFHSALSSPADESILLKMLEFYPAVCKMEDDNGFIPLHYVAAFLNTPASVVKKMISIYQYGLCHKSKDGDTPLHILVRNSADDVSFDESNKNRKKKLLNRNAIQILDMLMGNTEVSSMDIVKNLNEDYDPYFITNNESVCQILMAHPSGERAALATNDFGATPLHLAASHPNVCIDIAIAVGTSHSAIVEDKYKRTPLHIAAQNKHATADLIECIFELNPKACEILDGKGNLPLNLAVQSEAKSHIVEELLKAYPPAVKHTNNHLNTPLHDAVKHNASIEVIELLIEGYHDALTSPNEDGDIPLHCAVFSQATPDIFKVLLKICPESTSIQNKKGDCPLHCLVVYENTSIEILQLYLNASISSLLIKNKRGKIPFDIAKNYNASEEILQLLQPLGKD